jgi:hypothetical protein
MKFKTLLITCVASTAILFSSCNDEASDPIKCLNSVKSVYPNSKIYKHPESSFIFLVVDSLGMREVTTLNSNDSNVDGIIEYNLAEQYGNK